LEELLCGYSWDCFVLDFGFLHYIFFFTSNTTNKNATPAVSREGNQNCVLFNFYDEHDVWHALSAVGLFFQTLILIHFDQNEQIFPEDELLKKRGKTPHQNIDPEQEVELPTTKDSTTKIPKTTPEEPKPTPPKTVSLDDIKKNQQMIQKRCH